MDICRIGFYRLFPPDIGFPEPSRGDRLFPGVKANAIASLDMKVLEKRLVPAAERNMAMGAKYAYVDANHAGLNAMFEFASGSRFREDRGSVANAEALANSRLRSDAGSKYAEDRPENLGLRHVDLGSTSSITVALQTKPLASGTEALRPSLNSLPPWSAPSVTSPRRGPDVRG